MQGANIALQKAEAALRATVDAERLVAVTQADLRFAADAVYLTDFFYRQKKPII